MRLKPCPYLQWHHDGGCCRLLARTTPTLSPQPSALSPASALSPKPSTHVQHHLVRRRRRRPLRERDHDAGGLNGDDESDTTGPAAAVPEHRGQRGADASAGVIKSRVQPDR